MTEPDAAVSPHPSYLALDRFGLGVASSLVSQHVAGCEECQRYVELLTSEPPALELAAIQKTIAERRRRSLRSWWAGASVLAAAACLLLALGRGGVAPLEGPAPYVGAKGFASVWIYVKRGTATQLWDGKQSIRAGDRLRIKLDPSVFERVEVYAVKDPQAPALLYAGSVVPGQNSTLPEAWEVDDEPGAERLLVVLSHQPVTPAWDKWLKGEAPPGVLLLSFVLPKSSSAPADAADGSP